MSRLKLTGVVDSSFNLILSLFQDPNFPPNEDGNAMRKRIQKFQCKTITPVVRNMEILYRQQAMQIIHWMTNELEVCYTLMG